jgi:uncharacterized protein YndB with AHSA1/START domain
MSNVQVTKDLENKTLTIERTFNAPKEKLWHAYADKEMFESWWGPEGWETTVKEFDFAPGGKIHYGMKCVDENQGEWFGKESWGLMRLEVVNAPNSFSALDYFCAPDGTINSDMPTQRFSVEFIEEDGKTRLVTRSVTETAEQLEELVKMGMVEGFDSQLNKLEKLLAA